MSTNQYFIPGRGITRIIVNAKPVRVMVMPAGRFNDGFNTVRKAVKTVEYRKLGVDMPNLRYTHHALPKLVAPEAVVADNDNPQDADFQQEDLAYGTHYTMRFVSGKFVQVDLMAEVNRYSAVIMANAVRAAHRNDWDYQELVQDGALSICDMFPSHNEKSGPFCTRLAANIMKYRDGARKAAIFEQEFGIEELDAEPMGDNLDMGEMVDEPNEVAVADVVNVATEEMYVSEWIGHWIDKVEGMEPIVVLAMVLDLCFNMVDRSGELAEKEPEKKPWNRELTVPEYADDEDSVDVEGVNDDADKYASAASLASEGQPFEDEDFFDMADIEADRYCEAIGFGQFTHGGHSLHKPYVIVGAMDIGTDMKGDRPEIENSAELDAELDKLLPHLPTSSRMASKMSTFVSSLEDHKESHLSGFYQAGVIQACMQGYGWKQAIEVGKESHRIGMGQARLQTSQTMYSKKVEAPQGAPTFQQVAVKAAIGKLDIQAVLLGMVNSVRPSLNSLNKGLASKVPVKVLKLAELDRHVAIWGEVGSSNGGKYHTKVLFHFGMDGKRHLDGCHCGCEAKGACYHTVRLIEAATF